MSKYEIKKTQEEIDEQINKASVGIEEGTSYPAMSYEEGIVCFWQWLTGISTEKPFE